MGSDLYKWIFLVHKQYLLAEVNGDIFDGFTHKTEKSNDNNLVKRPLLKLKTIYSATFSSLFNQKKF